MDRTRWLTAEGITNFDLNNMPKDAMKGIANLAQALLGSTGPFATGFEATQTSSPSMSINIGAGQIYQLAVADASPTGDLPSDSTEIVQQGYAAAQTVALNTSSLTSGQSQWWLVQVQFQQLDQVRAGDPSSGNRGFYNSQNPSQPLDGPDGLGGTIDTVRTGFANISVISGAAATTGSNVPPSASAGYTGLYLIELSYGQTEITNGDIQIAGPGAYAGYPQAPFLAGLTQSHHNGEAGQAPPINLVTETQGILPVTKCGAAPTFYAGNPNGNVAGTAGQTCLDTTSDSWWVCTTTGTSSTAVWVSTTTPSTGPTVSYENTFPFTLSGVYNTYMCDLTSGAGVGNMPAASANANAFVTAIKVDSSTNTLTLTANGSDKFIYGSGAPASTLTLNNRGDSVTMQPIVIGGQGYWVVI